MCGFDSSGKGQGSIAGPCEHGNVLLCSIEGEEFLEQVSNYQLLSHAAINVYVYGSKCRELNQERPEQGARAPCGVVWFLIFER
jgi:hypothetical protein